MNLSRRWIHSTRFALACASVWMAQAASAETAYPLVCQGPLNLETSGGNDFTWSTTSASPTPPAQAHCAWLDRAPRGSELILGPKPPVGQAKDGNVLVTSTKCPKLQNPQGIIPLGPNQYIEVMVYQNPTTHYMQVQSWVGLVTPPFPTAPTEFPSSTRCTE